MPESEHIEDKRKTHWETIGAFCAAIAAIASVIAVIQTGHLWDLQTEFGRPYLVITPTFVVATPTSSTTLVLELKNIGTRPASSVLTRIAYMTDKPSFSVLASTTQEFGNDIPPGTGPKLEYILYNSDSNFALKKDHRYLVVQFCYKDSFTNNFYDETSYTYWPAFLDVTSDGKRFPWANIGNQKDLDALRTSFRSLVQSQDIITQKIIKRCGNAF